MWFPWIGYNRTAQYLWTVLDSFGITFGIFSYAFIVQFNFLCFRNIVFENAHQFMLCTPNVVFSLCSLLSYFLPSPYQQLFSDCISYGAAHFWTHLAWDSLMLWESYLADMTGENREETNAVGTEGKPWREKLVDRSTSGDFFSWFSLISFTWRGWRKACKQ